MRKNEGARFSDSAYSALVYKSIYDDVLAVCVGLRKDIPREHFRTLISKASRVVFEKLVAANPERVREVQEVLTGITGQTVAPEPERQDGMPKLDMRSSTAAERPTPSSQEFAVCRPARGHDRSARRTLPDPARNRGGRHGGSPRRQ